MIMMWNMEMTGLVIPHSCEGLVTRSSLRFVLFLMCFLQNRHYLKKNYREIARCTFVPTIP